MEPETITCPQCGMTSHHPKDKHEKFCGNCHQFHDDMQFIAGFAEVVTILGESKSTVANWINRDVFFPEPLVRLAMGPIWKTEEIIAYKKRKANHSSS